MRVRLPYARASAWDGLLGWLPSWFTPYHHQTEGFRRLRSAGDGGDRRPQPTLVITNTGSGKTESSLYPVLEHAVRARAQGRTGVKALPLHPMNPLGPRFRVLSYTVGDQTYAESSVVKQEYETG